MKPGHAFPDPKGDGMRLYIDFSAVVLLVIGLMATGATGAWAAGAPAPDRLPTTEGDLVLRPLNHATLAMEWNGRVVYVDPVGGAQRFEGLPRPDLVLITDIHFDHLNPETLKAVSTEKTRFVVSSAVLEQMPPDLRARSTVLTNGQSGEVAGIKIEAIAAYNLAPERQKFHAKGHGNGYVLTLGGKRVYLSGDTEDIPEMRALREIDVAFLCMNLPYTMTIEQAASAVRAFKPKIVYPYHCRGSNLEKFKQMLSDTAGVEVRVRDWYSKP